MYKLLFSVVLLISPPAWSQPAVKHFIPVADSKVYVEESGRGKALMLLHAGNMDHRMWQAQVTVLSKRFRVITCDLRGCGGTQDGDSTYLQSDALLAVMDQLKIGKATFAGVSLGAVAATAFALAHPGRVSKLILASPGLIGFSLDHDTALIKLNRQMEEAYRNKDTLAYTEAFVRAWVDGPHRKPASVNSRFRKKAFRMAYENVTKRKPGVHLGLTYSPSQLQLLPRLRMPILVITGALDMQDIRMIAEKFRQAGAKLAVLPAAAHMVNMEQPAAFNKLVLDFCW